VVLCYNGEVSNYIELKKKYKLGDKYHFKGSSDSEVLIYLYKERGIEFVSELTGMFSFCLYDKALKKAWLVRDFFGINPHFYAVSKENIYFASEIKALLEVPGLNLDINRQGIFDFLTFAYIPGAQTPYLGIKELRNGQMMEIDLRSGRHRLRYYFRPKYEVDYGIPEKEASKKVYDLLLSSVERNLRSDAPIGTTLSGGVDTSGITCLIRDLGRSQDFHTYSIKMGESSFDESHFQRLVAKECGTQHHEVLVTPEQVIENFYESVAYLDEPNGNGATVPSYILAKEAKKNVDVLLSGEGGDEVFNAYSVYAAWKIAKYYKKLCPKLLRKMIYHGVHALPSDYRKLSFDFMAKRFTEGCELHPGIAHIYWRHPFTNTEKESICSFSDQVTSTDERIVALFDEYSHTEELNRISMLDMEHFIVDDLLVKNDRMFLAHAVESRFPYLDRLLFDYVSTISPGLRLKGLRGRNIQKNALSKTLPPQILKRGNYGLEMPHSLWIFKSFRPLFEKYLNKKTIEATGLFSWEKVHQVWQAHLAKKRDHGRGLWCLLVYLVWHEMFIEKKTYKSYLRQTIL
ncbi:MAG: asparagine synthase (glutamine-hydrolyzing), partial [Bacteriovoracales bacterium]|nr:asparagine synthase (glutamine-hydrolyzing) [Bacteriovoracales bacterium]